MSDIFMHVLDRLRIYICKKENKQTQRESRGRGEKRVGESDEREIDDGKGLK